MNLVSPSPALSADVQADIIKSDISKLSERVGCAAVSDQSVSSWCAGHGSDKKLGLDEKVAVERFGVEEYIERQGADEGAENTLRACPGEIQQQVVASDLSNARNPSAVLLARIRILSRKSLLGTLKSQGRTFRQILSSPGNELSFRSNSVACRCSRPLHLDTDASDSAHRQCGGHSCLATERSSRGLNSSTEWWTLVRQRLCGKPRRFHRSNPLTRLTWPLLCETSPDSAEHC